MNLVWLGLAIVGAIGLLWYALRSEERYAAWRTIDLWDRAKDKSHDHAPRSVREWSGK